METVRICCSAATYSTIQAIFFFFSLGFRLQIHCCETKGGRQVLAATSTRLLDWSALNFNIGLLCTTSCRSRTHSFFNLSSHGHERLFYICGVLCTGFQKWNSKRICKFLQIEKQQTVSSHTDSYLTLLPSTAPYELQVPRPRAHSQAPACCAPKLAAHRAHCHLGTEVLLCPTQLHLRPRAALGHARISPTYLCCCIVYYFLCGQITLVPHQQLVDVFTGITVYLLQPLFYIIERLLGDKRTVSKTPHHDRGQHYSVMTGKRWRIAYLSACFTTTRDRTIMLLYLSTTQHSPDYLRIRKSTQDLETLEFIAPSPVQSLFLPCCISPSTPLYFPSEWPTYTIRDSSSSSCSREEAHSWKQNQPRY